MYMHVFSGFVQSTTNVVRSVLVDAVNDKCANYRRKKGMSSIILTDLGN